MLLSRYSEWIRNKESFLDSVYSQGKRCVKAFEGGGEASEDSIKVSAFVFFDIFESFQDEENQTIPLSNFASSLCISVL